MEERGPVQLVAPGLLGLLQLKADGRGVSKLGDTCVPSMEMLPWWGRAAAAVWPQSSTVNVPAGTVRNWAGFSPNSIQVAQGEWWFVQDYSVTFACAAASTATNVRLAWASTAGATPLYSALLDDPNAGKLITGPAMVLLTAQNFWLPPGARLGYFVDLITGAGGLDAACTQLRYARAPS